MWLFVMRFKRVEVQIVQDERETTAMIFKKLKYSNNYQISFMAPLLVFSIALILKIRQDNIIYT